jgi:hypothetical protein
MSASPRPPYNYRASTTHTSTIWLRPLATLIWHQRPIVDGAFAPNAKAIGAILAKILWRGAPPVADFKVPAHRNFGGVALHQNVTNFDADHGGTKRLTISSSSLALAGIGGG